jgi:LmbE family N-acetylglucosaminyl deacetylase
MRWAYRRALPAEVRNAVGLQRELARRELQPVVTAPPAGRRILVLAPHMDDEVFGCGGTLALAVAARSAVRVVFITDGSRGYDPPRVASLAPREHAAFERALSETRKAEARRAGSMLGYSKPVFLDLPDGRAAEAKGGVERLAQVIAKLAPEVVFLPFPADPHPDHQATNLLFAEAAAAAELGPMVQCWGYEIWTPLVANTFVDVTAVMESKRIAMAAYESQNAEVDYPRAMEALNAYRSLAAGLARAYVEAFFVETLDEYCALVRTFLPVRPR